MKGKLETIFIDKPYIGIFATVFTCAFLLSLFLFIMSLPKSLQDIHLYINVFLVVSLFFSFIAVVIAITVGSMVMMVGEKLLDEIYDDADVTQPTTTS